jgi:hypothetical protein
MGCGASAPRPPSLAVQGHVTLDGEPITSGMVVLHRDDVEPGAAPPMQAMGMIRPDGSYEIRSGPQEGAAPGHYKAVIIAMPTPGGSTARPRIPAKYTDPKTTDLIVEVKENPAPEHYDLRLHK